MMMKESGAGQKKESVPVLYTDRRTCCGCTACLEACPAGAISMKRDREGFLYPVIREDSCIRCGLCERVCAFKADQREKHTSCKADRFEEPLVYAVRHRDLDVRMASRSGGIFTALTDEWLAAGGVIYGCVLDEHFQAYHMRTESAADRDRMRGSKYIQSDLGDIFRNVREDLKSGREVLFSGTSCQVAGLRRFLNGNPENLFCVDIVCHGVPSPAAWKKYLQWQEEKRGLKAVSVDFRNKRDFGWKDHVESIYFSDGSRTDSTVFKNLFYGHWILRPSCFSCPYKDVMHPGDITIADYWGIDKAAPGFSDNKGVSLVLVNTPEGDVMFRKVSDALDFRETDLALSMQPPLQAPFPEPADRYRFWNEFYSKPFGYLARKYGTESAAVRLKKKYRSIRKKIAGRLKR